LSFLKTVKKINNFFIIYSRNSATKLNRATFVADHVNYGKRAY
jgi:hypothetical protein